MNKNEQELLKEIYSYNMQHGELYAICSGKPGKLKEELTRLKIAKTIAAQGLIVLEAASKQEVFAKLTTQGRIFATTI